MGYLTALSLCLSTVILLFEPIMAPPGGGDEPLLAMDGCDQQTNLCYVVGDTEMYYTQAWYFCHDNGMHLAMPKTIAQYQYLRQNILGYNDHYRVWIGLTDSLVESVWRWNDHELMINETIGGWKLGEPKDSRGHDEDCVEIQQNGWNNARCDTKLRRPLCQQYDDVCRMNSTFVLGDHCYRIYTTTGLRSAGTNTCYPGTLAMPKTQEINDYIYKINYGDAKVWLGLTRPEYEDWVWEDGEQTTTYMYQALFDTNFLPGAQNPGMEAARWNAYMIATGQWESSLEPLEATYGYVCQYPRAQTDCGSLFALNMVPITANTTEDFTHVVTCLPPFAPLYPTVTCLANGTWDLQPECIIDCGDLMVPHMVNITDFTAEGAVHEVTCVQGYVPLTSSVTCSGTGIWTPYPECLIDCGPVTVTNGVDIAEWTLDGDSHFIDCGTGFEPSGGKTTCMPDGTWDPYPICNPVDCGQIIIPNGNGINTGTTYQSSHGIVCYQGYIANVTLITCGADGNWTSVPGCNAVDCGVQVVPNGYDIVKNTTFGMTSDVICVTGYTSNVTSLSCGITGVWPFIPECTKVDCGDYFVSNGNAITGDTTYGAMHNVTCNLGFTSNVTSLHCDSDGMWSDHVDCAEDTSQVCWCFDEYDNSTSLNDIVAQIIRNLTIDKETLSSTRRKLTSAEDFRFSAKAIGVSGIIIMAIWCTFFLLNDVLTLIKTNSRT